MASLGHVAVGMAAARFHDGGRAPRFESMAMWSALSLLPDVDVIGFGLGVNYGDPWGHRGATHSLALCIAAGIAIGAGARYYNGRAIRTALLASAVLVSHALLDTMTDGGLGCALLWPFDLTRYFAPWRPIPVAPIGLGMFSPYGRMVVLMELALFAPLLIYALRSPPRVTRYTVALVAGWIAFVSSIAFSDRARDAVTGFLLREDTAYASGYSEGAFRAVAAGQSESQVRERLGLPFTEIPVYGGPDTAPPNERPALDAAALASAKRSGVPRESCWEYTRSPRGGPYRLRVVCFADGRVASVLRGWE